MNAIQVILHRILIMIAIQVFRHAEGSSKILLFSTSAFTSYFWEKFLVCLWMLTALKQGLAACCARLKSRNGKAFLFISVASNNELSKWDTEDNKRFQLT